MAKVHVTTTINGEPMEFLCEPNDTMLDALRGPLGADRLQGRLRLRRLRRLLDHARRSPGLLLPDARRRSRRPRDPHHRGHGATASKLHPLQQKFLEMAALQCGICTSGMLVASDALLQKNPEPSEEEVRFWLAGNLCRCTGYDKIVRAVMETAAEMREQREAAQ